MVVLETFQVCFKRISRVSYGNFNGDWMSQLDFFEEIGPILVKFLCKKSDYHKMKC